MFTTCAASRILYTQPTACVAAPHTLPVAVQTLKLKCRVCAVRTHAVFELTGNLYIKKSAQLTQTTKSHRYGSPPQAA